MTVRGCREKQNREGANEPDCVCVSANARAHASKRVMEVAKRQQRRERLREKEGERVGGELRKPQKKNKVALRLSVGGGGVRVEDEANRDHF